MSEEHIDLKDSTYCNDKTVPNADNCLRAELPVPPSAQPAQTKDSAYVTVIANQHDAKVQADSGDWDKANTLYQKAIVAADKLDRKEIGQELTHVRAELKAEHNPTKQKELTAEEQKLYQLYQAPVSTRTNYALACYRYGFIEEGDKAWSAASRLDVTHDLNQHPAFINQVRDYRDNIMQREESVVTTLNLLQKANGSFKSDGKMTPDLKQQYEQAIKTAEAAESKLDQPLLKTESINLQNQLTVLNLDNKLSEFKTKVTAYEATLPADQRAKLTDIDKSIAALQPEQGNHQQSDFEEKLSALVNQRAAVYKLPSNLATESDQLNKIGEKTHSLEHTMGRDYTLLHLPAFVKMSFAQALDDSGQHDAAVQQRQEIAASDKEFYDSIISGAVAGMDGIPGAADMAKALDLVNSNNGQLTAESRVLFDQARIAADDHLNKDRTQFEGQIKTDQKELEGINQTKLAHYNQLFSEWKTNNPDGKTWDTMTTQIASQKEQLGKLNIAADQHEALQHSVDDLTKKCDELLPLYLKNVQTALAPVFQRVDDLQKEIGSLQQKLNVETRMSAMVRVYEVVALKQSGDPAQIKEAEGLLKDVVFKTGANPQDIAQAASDVMQTSGMGQAEPIFKAAVEMSDIARKMQQEDAAKQIVATAGYNSDPVGSGIEAALLSNSDSFSINPRDKVLEAAPAQTRWLYAVSVFNSGEKKEGIEMLEQLRQQTADIRTIATLDVAKDLKTSTITEDLLKAAAEKVAKNEGYMQQTAGMVDMLSTVVAARFGAGPYSPVIGSAVGTASLAAMDYALYGRVPTAAQVAVYAGLGWGIGATSGIAESLVSSQAARFITPRAFAKANAIIGRYAPDSLSGLSELPALPRLEATSGVLNTMYRAEKGNASWGQYLFGRGGSRTYKEILDARVSVKRANMIINALGFGAAAGTPYVVVKGVGVAASEAGVQ